MRACLQAGLMAIGLIVAMPVAAQVTSVDPDVAIDDDIGYQSGNPDYNTAPDYNTDYNTDYNDPSATGSNLPPEADAPYPEQSSTPVSNSATYSEDDLIGAGVGLFGKSAKGFASVIRDILRRQGEPNGYIVGREAGGAVAVGLRYGSGTLFHKVEGERSVYWTGPSIGFDVGANASKTFVLVYNLYDTEELFQRFPAVEGEAYFIGGFTVSYMRAGNKVVIPVRVGAGLRLGANVGYMKFARKQQWFPF